MGKIKEKLGFYMGDYYKLVNNEGVKLSKEEKDKEDFKDNAYHIKLKFGDGKDVLKRDIKEGVVKLQGVLWMLDYLLEQAQEVSNEEGIKLLLEVKDWLYKDLELK